MVAVKFTSIFDGLRKRKLTQDAREGGSGVFNLAGILKLNFSIYVWMLVGASIQALAVYLFSSGQYVLLISTLALVAMAVKTFMQTYGILPNPYLQDVIPGRTTALLPDENTGEVTEASSRKIAVLHLGAKSNHPLGMFAPQFQKVGEYLTKMNKALDRGEVKGFLGQTTFNRVDERGVPEIVLMSYWESTEDLWAFAHNHEAHTTCWRWWDQEIKLNGYVGINHEIFEAEAKHWENIYINFQPTMMGATTYVVKDGKRLEGGKVEDKYISPLIDARRGPLAKSSVRMGRPITIHDQQRTEKGLPTYDNE